MATSSRTRSRFIAGAVFGLLAASALAWHRPDYIVTPRATLLLMPPVPIAVGDVDQQSWSSDGNYCAVVVRNKDKAWLESSLGPQIDARHVPQPAAELYVWSRRDGSVKRIWSNVDPLLSVGSLVWVHGTSELLISATTNDAVQVGQEPQSKVGLCAVNATNGQFLWYPPLDNAALITLSASPTKPLAEAMVLQVGKASTLSGTLCAINADGEIVNRTAVDGPMVYAPTVWSADGSTLLFQDMRKRSLLKPQPDGTFAKTSEQPYKPTERNPELVLTAKPGVTKIRSEHKNLSSLWLSSAATTEHPDAFISADGTDPSIAPTYDAVFYEEGGIAKIRTWTPLTDEQKKSLMDAIKADAISAAKQVALGLLMFSTDNDDVLPGSGGLDSLLPYLKDSSLLDGFNYTPPANLNSSQWTSPSETVVGTVLGPGGSAVAYGDGHVKWHPNP